MVSLTIDNQVVTVPPGMTIVAAAQTAGITIPTLCYLPGICQVAACRVCAVEIVGDSNLAAACNTQVESGMVIHTNSRRAREARRTNV
ncbi:MAG: 2Fe-2S iron-sulfur cluster-binding protein, partial [Symbiobacteriaceae bacterium]|nr:2Fe-2S iron-sulfur cluster-binding protein [Symbiobacteriaceae bacterium]